MSNKRKRALRRLNRVVEREVFLELQFLCPEIADEFVRFGFRNLQWITAANPGQWRNGIVAQHVNVQRELGRSLRVAK